MLCWSIDHTHTKCTNAKLLFMQIYIYFDRRLLRCVSHLRFRYDCDCRLQMYNEESQRLYVQIIEKNQVFKSVKLAKLIEILKCSMEINAIFQESDPKSTNTFEFKRSGAFRMKKMLQISAQTFLRGWRNLWRDCENVVHFFTNTFKCSKCLTIQFNSSEFLIKTVFIPMR